MKKILIISMAYYPHVGGAEVAVKEITNRIARSDMEFHMVTLRLDARDAREERIGNVVVHRIGRGSSRLSKFLFQLTASLAALRLHRRQRFDLVWAIMAHSAGVPAALFKMRYPGVPLLLTLQEGDPPEQIERTMRPLWPLFTRAFKEANAVQVISTFLGAWARQRGFAGEPVIIGNGVDIAHFSRTYPPEALLKARTQFVTASTDTLLVTTSRLVHKNGIDDVIRALTHLPPAVHFVIYGTGPEEGILRALAGELALDARVHFMGHVSHEGMPKILQACDIFVRPSRSEGMGNSFIEAMAAGLPVIATQEGGIADFLTDRERNAGREPTGFAVDKNSPEQIAQKVAYILAHKDEVEKTVENAKKLVVERYDWDHIALQMRALLLGLCASS